jgi:hypothetical protein
MHPHHYRHPPVHTQRDGNSKGDDERRKEKKTPKCLPSPHLDTTGQPVDDESPLKNLRREALAYMCVFYIQEEEELASLNLVSLTRARERRFLLATPFKISLPSPKRLLLLLFLPYEHRSPTHWISILFFLFYFQVIGAFLSFNVRIFGRLHRHFINMLALISNK